MGNRGNGEALRHYDQAISDLSWRFGGDAEAALGVHGQAIEGGRGKRVFDAEASWRLMEGMVSHRADVVRWRHVEATISHSGAHAVMLRLAFTPLGGRANVPLRQAFTVGRVCLLALVASSEAASQAHTHKRKTEAETILEWLNREACAPHSSPTFERLRTAAETLLLHALQAYVDAEKAVHEARKTEEDRRVQEVRQKVERGRRRSHNADVQRVARVVADALRLERVAGYE